MRNTEAARKTKKEQHIEMSAEGPSRLKSTLKSKTYLLTKPSKPQNLQKQ